MIPSNKRNARILSITTLLLLLVFFVAQNANFLTVEIKEETSKAFNTTAEVMSPLLAYNGSYGLAKVLSKLKSSSEAFMPSLS